jgi:hypothetical protein
MEFEEIIARLKEIMKKWGQRNGDRLLLHILILPLLVI